MMSSENGQHQHHGSTDEVHYRLDNDDGIDGHHRPVGELLPLPTLRPAHRRVPQRTLVEAIVTLPSGEN